MQGNSRSLWSAVKIAKDTGTNDIPQNMSYNGVVVAGNEVAESFAQFFENKVSKIVNSSQIYQNVYNRRTKMFTVGSDFMTAININIYKCVNQLKLKNCEGNDRIPPKTLFFQTMFQTIIHLPTIGGR